MQNGTTGPFNMCEYVRMFKIKDEPVILDDAELDKAAGGYHTGYSSRRGSFR